MECLAHAKVLGSENSVEVGGVRRQCSNFEVRQAFGTYTLASIMRKRRLDWLQNIVNHADENKQLRAAVFGDLRCVSNIDMPWNPWVLQWEQDLTEFARVSDNTESFDNVKNSGCKSKYCLHENMGWFVNSK